MRDGDLFVWRDNDSDELDRLTDAEFDKIARAEGYVKVANEDGTLREKVISWSHTEYGSFVGFPAGWLEER